MANPNQAKIDICFVIDATGSMQPYIDAAAESINEISAKILQNTKIKSGDLRVSVLAFRDHQNEKRGWQEEWSTATKVVTGFTSDMNKVQTELQGLRAKDGGDGPEAVGTALSTVLASSELVWRERVGLQTVQKYVILITDAPPHGWNAKQTEVDDVTPDLIEAKTAVTDLYGRGITLFVVMCYEEMKFYPGAEDYYKKWQTPSARLKSKPKSKGTPQRKGATVLLKDANKIGEVILALVLEGYKLADFDTDLKLKNMKNASKIGTNLTLIANGDGRKDDLMSETKMLLGETQFFSLETNIPVSEQARKGTEDLEQTFELKSGPINDHQLERLVALYVKGEENLYEYYFEDDNQAQQPARTDQKPMDDNVKQDHKPEKKQDDEDKEPVLPEDGEIPDSYWEKKAAWDAKHR